MNVGAIGYNYTHDADFVMSRPDGNGCWLMLFVKENSLFEIGGSHYKVKKNSVVIFSPETPCSYGGDGGKYTDDWLFFHAMRRRKRAYLRARYPDKRAVLPRQARRTLTAYANNVFRALLPRPAPRRDRALLRRNTAV